MSDVDHHAFCIVCAKPEEQAQVNRVFENETSFKRVRGRRVIDDVYEVGGGYTVKLTACAAMGHMHAAVRTTQVILSSHPELVFFVGTAASLAPSEVQLGDVVVPRKAVSRIYEKVSEAGQQDYDVRAGEAEFEHFLIESSKNTLITDLSTKDCSEDGLSAFARLNVSEVALEKGTIGDVQINGQKYSLRDPKVHQDLDIFSCGMVVDSISYRDMIGRLMRRAFRKAAVIDMESYGFYRAVEAASTIMKPEISCSGLMIRGISDYAGRKRDTESRPDGWKDKAVRNAAIVTGALIKRLSLT